MMKNLFAILIQRAYALEQQENKKVALEEAYRNEERQLLKQIHSEQVGMKPVIKF